MATPQENKREAYVEFERDAIRRWEDEGGKTVRRINEAGNNQSILGRAPKMATYQVGDTVIHWTYGSGKIKAIEDKGLPGQPCFYYIIEGSNQTLWVPVDEGGISSLHLVTPRAEFGQLISILRSSPKRLSNNPHHRRKALNQDIQRKSLASACRTMRDLNYHARWQKLSSSDIRILRSAQSHLLDEWEQSLGTPREMAKREMEWILKETSIRQWISPASRV